MMNSILTMAHLEYSDFRPAPLGPVLLAPTTKTKEGPSAADWELMRPLIKRL